MKIFKVKPILSAIAMSLFFVTDPVCAQVEAIDDFMGLETEILPELEGPQKFTTSTFHQDSQWQVEEKNVIQDSGPLKGQSYSMIPWKTETPEELLDIEKWIRERNVKDKNPEWKIRLRVQEHRELMGKVLTCKGSCEIYRGTQRIKAQHLSRVYEEDEFHVGQDSMAWVFLLDGSLVRVSSSSFVNFQEINFTPKEVFVLLRLGEGHMFWHPRRSAALEKDESPETDPQGLPLLVREANQAYFERKIYQRQTEFERLGEMLSIYDRAIDDAYADINARRAKSPAILKTRLMAILPNFTAVSEDDSVDFIHVMGGKSYFKKRTHSEASKFHLWFRGYASTDEVDVGDTNWREVDASGRNLAEVESSIPGAARVLELLTKRIKTYELAREIWYEKFTLPLLAVLNKPEIFARDFGYSLWGDELSKRESFIVEDGRRRETTNLRSMQNLLEKLALRGDARSTEIDERLYQASVNSYLMSLKMRYDMRHLERRHMSDLQYYVWILKNVKR